MADEVFLTAFPTGTVPVATHHGLCDASRSGEADAQESLRIQFVEH